MAHVSAIILNYRRAAGTANVVRCLFDGTVIPTWVTVVDNYSGVDELDLLEKQLESWPSVEIVASDRNGGYAAGMNLGVLRNLSLRPDYFLLLTHDCQLEPGALSNLISALESDSESAVAGPLLKSRTSGDVFSAGGWIDAGRCRIGHYRNARACGTSRVDWIDGAAILVRREILERTSIDTQYFLYYEDVDLCLTVRKMGRKILLVESAKASQTTDGMPVFYAARNRYLLARKWFSRSVRRRTVGEIALDACGRAIRGAVRRRRSEMVEAWNIVRGLASGIGLHTARGTSLHG